VTKPLGELTDADVATLASVVAHRAAADDSMESWDVSLFSSASASGSASGSARATDVVSLHRPVSEEQVTEHVAHVLRREGLEVELPWRTRRDGYLMSAVFPLDWRVERRRVVDPVTQVELLVPPGITDARAIERARRQRAGELHRIRFFPEWGCDYPLWEDFTDKYTMEPGDYGISPELGRRLRDWARFWQRHLDPFDGWDDPGNEREWLATGDELVRALELEVYDIAVVVPEFR
jgi:hypothetical protein